MTGAAGFASGDTAYLSPAGPFREVVTVAMTSATAETQIIGDPANAQGFKTSGGVLVTPGDVIWTAYLTDETTAPSTSALLNLAGRDFLTFKNIILVGGSNTASCIAGTTTNSVNITFRDCAFINSTGNQGFIGYTGLADVASNWVIDRCHFCGSTAGTGFTITLPTSSAADYDSNFLIQNCIFSGISANCVSVTASGALSFKGGGVDVFNCLMFTRGAGLLMNSANLSTSIPCTIYNSIICSGGGTALAANASGQILEDYNRILASTPRSNVTAGANSISDSSHAFLMEFGQNATTSRLLRPFGMPMANSPLLGRGNQAGGPTVDILNRPRPADYAWGAYERHDTGVRETSTVHTGSNAIVITGPGDHDFYVPVDATSTTLTIYARYDTDHAATNKPQMTVLNGEEIGVTSATATMTAAVNTWEQISLTFTPTAKGIVTIRLISRSAAATGKAFFDTFAY